MKKNDLSIAFFDNVYIPVRNYKGKLGIDPASTPQRFAHCSLESEPRAPIGQLLYRFKRENRETISNFPSKNRSNDSTIRRLSPRYVTRAILPPIVVVPSIKETSLNAVERPWTFSRIFLPGAVHQKSFCAAHAFERMPPTVHHRSNDLDYKFRTQLVRGKKWRGEERFQNEFNHSWQINNSLSPVVIYSETGTCN